MRGCSTTACTRAATPARGSRSASRRAATRTASRSRPAQMFLTGAAGTQAHARPGRARRGVAQAARSCSRRCERRSRCALRTTASASTPGATRSAACRAARPRDVARRGAVALAPGDVLLFEEVIGPETGDTADADPQHRHAVRLLDRRRRPPTRSTAPRWSRSPGARTTRCRSRCACRGASARRGSPPTSASRAATSCSPITAAASAAPTCCPPSCRSRAATGRSGSSGGITHAQGFDPVAARAQSARAATLQDPTRALPRATLSGDGRQWTPRFDLLASDRFAPEFVLEVESDGRAYARFGDDVLGKRPSANATFTATYRVGNGAAGNVGREAIAQTGHDARRPRVRAQPDRGDGRHRSRADAARALRRAAGVPHAGARGHRGRLRARRRASCRRAARRGALPLDRQLVHRVRHRRPQGRTAGRRRLPPRHACASRALPSRRLRPRDPRAAVRAARHRDPRLRRGRATSAPT